jgi:hypothetical protein
MNTSSKVSLIIGLMLRCQRASASSARSSSKSSVVITPSM